MKNYKEIIWSKIVHSMHESTVDEIEEAQIFYDEYCMNNDEEGK